MNTVDVIIPCYRYGMYLHQCVQSVLDQQGVCVRVLILDDASPDNTPELASSLAAEDSRVSYVHSEINFGHIATYNQGIKWVSSEYMLLLSADDYLLPGALERATGLMSRYPEVGFVTGHAIGSYANGKFLPDKSEIDPSLYPVMSGMDFINASLARNRVATATAVTRTSIQKMAGYYLEELPHTADMEMWLRLATLGSVGVVDEFQAVYRRHATNMSSGYKKKNLLKDLEQRREAIDHFLGRFEVGSELRKTLSNRMFTSLSEEAVGCASWAFNDGELQVSENIARFAVSIDEGITNSWSWKRYSIKRKLGYGVWKVVQPALARAKRANTSVTKYVKNSDDSIFS